MTLPQAGLLGTAVNWTELGATLRRRDGATDKILADAAVGTIAAWSCAERIAHPGITDVEVIDALVQHRLNPRRGQRV